MKLWMMLGLAVLLVFGVSLWVVGWGENTTAQDDVIQSKKLTFPAANAPQPKVEVVGSDHYDFGWMEPDTEQKHSFMLRNAGQGELELVAGQTTCKCTFNGLDRARLRPGESTPINIEWHPLSEDPRFRQVAPIYTNDRTQPELKLVVMGRVAKLISVDRDQVAISGVSTTVGGQSTMLIYSSVLDHFALKEPTWADEETAKFFEMVYNRASNDDLKSFDAKCGYAVTVRVKPGLPLGRFQQKMVLATDVVQSAPQEILINGSVVGPISIAGADGGWNDQTGILTLGTVDNRTGVTKELMLYIKGEHQDIHITKIEVHPPDVLQITPGELIKTRTGKVSMLPVEVKIPVGARPVNCWGTTQGRLGRLIITTDHPETPVLQLMLKFAVRSE